MGKAALRGNDMNTHEFRKPLNDLEKNDMSAHEFRKPLNTSGKNDMNTHEFLKPLNALRGIGSVIIAYFFHYNHFVESSRHPLYFLFPDLCNYGWVMVELFFLLSGITFMSFFSDNIRSGKIDGKTFAIKRFSKLWPVHFVTLCMTAAIQCLRSIIGMEQFKFIANDLYDFILSALFMQEFNLSNGASYNWPAWTLSVNIICYFLFFFICKNTKDSFSVITVGILMICFGLEMMKERWSFVFFCSNVGRGLVSFFWGVIIVIVYRAIKNKRYLSVGIITMFFICLLISKYLGNDLSNHSTVNGAVFSITYYTFLIFFSLKIPLFRRVLLLKPLQMLGDLSYSLFMVHYPIQVILDTVNRGFHMGWDYSGFTFWIVYVCLVLAAAVLCNKLIEKKCMIYIRKNAGI